jgi:hypothetical protein
MGAQQHLALAKVCMLRCITSREARRDHSLGRYATAAGRLYRTSL